MKNRIISQLIILTLLFSGTFIQAQGLLDKIDNELSNEILDEIATFKTTRIGLGHSIETRKKGALEISLYNRYWNIPDFAGQRFLADKVSSRFGLDYAFSDNFSLSKSEWVAYSCKILSKRSNQFPPFAIVWE